MLQNRVNFNLSWNNHDNYWICIVSNDASEMHNLEKDLKTKNIGESFDGDGFVGLYSPRDWAENWKVLKATLDQHHIINSQNRNSISRS